MEKANLTAQDYALALFVLCADVSCWEVRKEDDRTYYYFNPKDSKDLNVLQYILRKNNVHAKRHASRQYSGAEYSRVRKVLRVPTSEFFVDANRDFLKAFRDMRGDDENRPVPMAAGAHKWFALWSKNKKAKLIRELIERSK